MIPFSSAPTHLPASVCASFFKPHILSAKSLFLVHRHRSFIGLPRHIRETCYSLGLRHRGHVHFLVPTKETIGKLVTIKNLVRIKFLKNGPFPANLLAQWSGYRGFPTARGYILEQAPPFADVPFIA
jgi:ribosomal protein L30/L7E